MKTLAVVVVGREEGARRGGGMECKGNSGGEAGRQGLDSLMLRIKYIITSPSPP